MDPVRILQVVPAMGCGGMETFIMNVYRNIDRSRVQFDFLCHYARPQFYDREIESLGGRIYRLSVREDNDFPRYLRELKAFFRDHPEYRVIHGHYSGFGMFYNHYAKKYGVACRIGHSHSEKYEQGLIGQLDRFMSKPFRWGLTDRMACSRAAGEFLFGRLPFSVYCNGIDPERFAFCRESRREIRQRYGLEENAWVVGHVGRFAPVKNHGFLLEAFARLCRIRPESRLLLVGTGDGEDQARRQAQELGIRDRVIFAGGQQDTWKYYSAFDVFALPSLFEGIPLSLVEAQAGGLPCLASDKVNRDVNVTGGVQFLPLEPQAWAGSLAGTRERMEPGRIRSCMAGSGYDIGVTAAALQDFYLKHYGGSL